MGIIDVQDLSKDYFQYKVFSKGKLLTKALKHVSFSIKKGDFFGLLGVNGAGKSTLLKILTTNLTKSSGSAMIDGMDIERHENEIKQKISWMFGIDYTGVGWSSLEKNMLLAAYFMGLSKQKAERRVKELLTYFELYKHRKLDVWRLSAGMEGKYALAIAMLKEPEILFLDEPLLGLDVPTKDSLREYLVQLNKEGTTIIYTDHQLQEMEKVCRNVVMIHDGEKVYDGDMESLKQTHRDTHILECVCQAPHINRVLLQASKQMKFIRDYELLESQNDVHKVKIFTNIDSKLALAPVGNFFHKHQIVIESLNAGLLSLEDVFKKFLQKNPEENKAEKLRYFKQAHEKPLKKHVQLLQHEHHQVRSAACALLYSEYKDKVNRTLKNMLDMTRDMQLASIRVIGDTKSKALLHAMKKKLKGSDLEIKANIVVALAKIGEDVVDEVMELLLNGESCKVILENVEKFDEEVLVDVCEQIKRLRRSDLYFLLHHIKQTNRPEKILETLQLHNYKKLRRT